MLYRSLRSIQPWGVVPPSSHKVSRVSWYSGSCLLPSHSAYGTFTLSRWSSQFHSAMGPLTYGSPKPRGASHLGLGSFPFARRYSGNHGCFLFLRLLRCFSSPGSLRITIGGCPSFMMQCMELFHAGFPIQISADHWIFAPPRGFSQLITSFFGS